MTDRWSLASKDLLTAALVLARTSDWRAQLGARVASDIQDGNGDDIACRLAESLTDAQAASLGVASLVRAARAVCS